MQGLSFISRIYITVLFLLALCLSFSVDARDDDTLDKLSINGFYTLDLTFTDSDLAVTSNNQERLIYDKQKPKFSNSLIGTQISYQLSDDLSFLLQGTLGVDGEDKLTTKLNWGYLSYDLNDDAQLRAGKFQTPFLQGTELRRVGYSRIWARPIVPGNGASGFNQYKGIDYLKKITNDAGYWEIQLGLGLPEHDLDFFDNEKLALSALRYQLDDDWIRVALVHVDYDIYAVSGRLISNDATALLASVEAEVNAYNWTINIGASNSNSDITPDDSMAYLSAAYPIGDFTPYAYVVWRQQHFESFTVEGGPRNPMQPGMQNGPPPQLPIGGPNGVSRRETAAIGVRWNLSERMVVKAHLDHSAGKNDTGLRPEQMLDDGTSVSILLEGVF